MRRPDPEGGADIDAAQRSMADSGIKSMIRIGAPFLDYVISALADAGIGDVCLVIGPLPEHRQIRDYYGGEVELERVRVHFVVQERPLGTADAVAAAESFAAGEHVLVLNADNYYPVHALRALRELEAAGLAAFERDALVRLGNIDANRVAQFSVLRIDEAGMLERIVEKPDAATVASLGSGVFIGMNCWSLPPEIYRSCRSIRPSARGELELPDAVQHARDELGIAFTALRFRAGVLDLSTRGDIAAVAHGLRNVEPRL